MIREKKDFSENKNGGVQMWRKKKKDGLNTKFVGFH